MKIALARFLQDKLEQQRDNPLWSEDKYGSGNTEIGFDSTFELDYEALAAEIDKWIAENYPPKG
jgi:hypothetical protein